MEREIRVVSVENTEGLYHYRLCGLNNYYLSKGLYHIDYVDGEEVVRFPKMDEVHAAIGMHLCGLLRPLGPREVRFLRKALDMSQNDLGISLGYKDKQVVAKAEKVEGGKHLSAGSDMLLRERYLNFLGRTKYVGAKYKTKAIEMSKHLNGPHEVQEDIWQIAA